MRFTDAYAGATVLRLVTGSPYFGATFTFKAGMSAIEPGLTPAQDVVLSWPTFDQAADEAGISRRYGGIHFATADMAGRTVGFYVGDQAFNKAQTYWKGTATGMLAP